MIHIKSALRLNFIKFNMLDFSILLGMQFCWVFLSFILYRSVHYCIWSWGIYNYKNHISFTAFDRLNLYKTVISFYDNGRQIKKNEIVFLINENKPKFNTQWRWKKLRETCKIARWNEVTFWSLTVMRICKGLFCYRGSYWFGAPI